MDPAHNRALTARVRAFFDQHAPGWDAGIPPETLPRIAEILDGLDIAPGSRVLDVGAGTGVLAPMLAPRIGPGGRLVSVDISFRMLEAAMPRARAHHTILLQADVAHAPFCAGSFDWVICYSVFPHFLDQAHCLRELRGLLTPGGRLAVCHSRSREEINAFHRTVGDVVGGHTLPAREDMLRLLETAGLRPLALEEGADRYLALAQRDF